MWKLHCKTETASGRPRVHSRMVAGLLAATMLAGTSALEPAAAEKTITGVMHSGLRVLDPIITTAHITRDHAYMIYDVLVAVDENFQPQPQMADWTISDDKLTYTFKLRDGLKFHDGNPVTARDAVASLKRWGKRDSGGQLIFDVTESLEATDDKTLVWKLKKPFPALLEIVGKQSAVPPFIMPERVANTPPDQAITDYTGSGPFVFVESEYQPGVSVTYKKFADYVPRNEPPSWMAGGKVVKVDRVRWVSMPDTMTSVNALLSGEVDYLEQMPYDLLPLVKNNPDVALTVFDPQGYQTVMRMNHLHPPFDNKLVRQAAMYAVDQTNVLQALVGNPEYYRTCPALFGCGLTYDSQVGAEVTVKGNIEKARELLKQAGYKGEPVVILQPTDAPSVSPQPVVIGQALREAGFNVQMQAMDWQTLVTRRASQAKPSEGGWNLFFTNWMVPEINSPLISPMLNGRGDQAWFGWPKDDQLEALRAEFIEADTPEKQREVAVRIQKHVLENVIYIPLGQYAAPQARSKKLTGMIPSPVPVFWNIEKAD